MRLMDPPMQNSRNGQITSKKIPSENTPKDRLLLIIYKVFEQNLAKNSFSSIFRFFFVVGTNRRFTQIKIKTLDCCYVTYLTWTLQGCWLVTNKLVRLSGPGAGTGGGVNGQTKCWSNYKLQATNEKRKISLSLEQQHRNNKM